MEARNAINLQSLGKVHKNVSLSVGGTGGQGKKDSRLLSVPGNLQGPPFLE